ncbi:hypothetical protein AAD018_006505 [Aestuariibius insulae]|uniref:hypothetical protein n=1 Tax=Aestuariibius insulae TaxID=2058287 RepID=UPI00345E0FAC
MIARSVCTFALIAFACDAVAQSTESCPWADDAELANHLSDTAWHLQIERGTRIEGSTARLNLPRREASFTIGAFLSGSSIDDVAVDLRLIAPSDAIEYERGRNTFAFGLAEDTPCRDGDLSDIRATASTVVDDHSGDVILTLRPIDEASMRGYLRLEEWKRNGAQMVTIETISATLMP